MTEYYFMLINGKTYIFRSYYYAMKFYEDNELDVLDTNFNYL